MKKLIAIVVLLLLLVVGLWGASSYWFGVKTEEQYHAMLRQASQWQYLTFANESYSRGLFGSRAQTVVEIQSPPGAPVVGLPIKLTLIHDIGHGPLPLGKLPDGEWQLKPLMGIIQTKIVLSSEVQSHLAELYRQVPELAAIQNYILIDFAGNGEEHFLIPAFKHTMGNEEKVAVDWKGLNLQVNFTADLKGFTGSLNAPGLEVSADDFDLNIKEVKSTFNFHEGAGGLSLGDGSFDIVGLEVAGKKETELHALLVRGFNVMTSNKESGDNINCLAAMRIEQVKLDEAQYGPGVFEMEFKNLDAPSLVKLQRLTNELQPQNRPKPAEEMQGVILAKYMEVLPGLLKKSPVVEIAHLDLKTSDGDLKGKARIAFDGTKSVSTENLLAIAGGLSAQGELEVGERLLHRVASSIIKSKIIAESKEHKQIVPDDQEIDATVSAMIEEQLQSLMVQNIVVKEKGDYKVSAGYAAGQIVLNGRPLPLQSLLE